MFKSKLLFLSSMLIGVLTSSNDSIAMKITSSSNSSKSCSANRVRVSSHDFVVLDFNVTNILDALSVIQTFRNPAVTPTTSASILIELN